MKFYFDGDSFTYGGALDKVLGLDVTKYRWSKLVCDHFGAEEINLSSGGASNDLVMRQTFSKPPTEVYDFYFLQTTFPNRHEFYDTKKEKWMKIRHLVDHPSNNVWKRWGSEEGSEFAKWIDFGARRIYNDYYGKTKENITYNALKSFVSSIGREKKSFFSTCLKPEFTDNKYDMHLHHGTYTSPQPLDIDRIPGDGHPSVEGHKTIAKYVIDIVSERL